MNRIATRLVRALVVVVCLIGSASVVQAATATWNANPEADIAGYIVSYGTVSGVYTTRLNVGNVTSVLIALAPGVQYFLVCQAYNTNGVPSSYSTEVVFTVDAGAPVFGMQPTSRTVMSGQSGSFRAVASGEPAPTYQWQVSSDSGASWADLTDTALYSGVTTDTLTLTTPAVALTGAQYRAVARSSAGTTPSNAAMLTVEVPVPPTILAHPNNQTVTAGQDASFTMAAGGTTPTYQWQISLDESQTFANLTDTAPYSGVTTPTLTLTGVTAGLSGARYRAVASNSVGTATSNAARLIVNVAPTIIAQPTDQVVLAGMNVAFAVAASGTPAPTFQWQISTDGGVSWANAANAAPYSQVTAATLTMTSVPAGATGYQYRCVAANSVGSATSNVATLTVTVAPAITTQPADQTVTAGQNASFTATAGGNPTPTFLWQVSTDAGVSFTNLTNAAPYRGVGTATLTIASVTTGLTGTRYRVVAANSLGSATSNAATLTLIVAPAITAQPVNQTVTAGQNASFTIAASGTPVLSYQWQVSTNGGTSFADLVNAAPYSGVTTGTLTITNVAVARSGDEYRAVVINAAGSATSNAAALAVMAPPIITTQPADLTVRASHTGSFSVAASGGPSPTYQWQVSTNGGASFTNVADAAPYSGATTAALTVTNVTTGLAGNRYRAVATNSEGTATSNAATLTVSDPPTITTQPVEQVVTAGQVASFSVVASGTPTPTYQWQASIDAITWTNLTTVSATTANLTLTATSWWNATRFRCVVTNVGGSDTSNAVTLTVYGAVTVTPSSLFFTASKAAASSTLSALTPAQGVLNVGFSGQPTSWTATSDQPWLQIDGGSGGSAGQFTVKIVNPGNVIGGSTMLKGSITLTVTASVNWPVVIPVTLLITQTLDATPFGSFDTPIVTSRTAQDSVALGGWALANGSLDRVEIWRDPVAGDTNPSQGAGPANGKIFVATAGAIDGARPDVEAQFSNDPQVTRAGWGYLLETRGLSTLGDGVYTLYAIAHAADGVSAILGTRTLVVDNANASLPFGTLDTPAEGALVAGIITVTGWALTPESGCTIIMGAGPLVGASIDSGPVLPVHYGQVRSDIAARFPGFTNSDRAGGSVVIDTTALSDGTHQISWSVSDSCGRQAWIGTRFFSVQNGGAVTQSVASGAAVMSQAAKATINWSPIAVQKGQAAWSLVNPGAAGVRVLKIDERVRVNVQLPTQIGATYAGYHRVGDAWRALPLGSSLNSQTGLFSWEPAAGFVGSYDLAFLTTAADGAADVASLRIVVGPSVRLWIDAPPANVEIQQPFELTGWVIDLAALDDAGIETAQVWASAADGSSRVLIGTATTREARPDVAAMFGTQFANSGFRLLVDRLPPGAYDLVISADASTPGSLRSTTAFRVTVH